MRLNALQIRKCAEVFSFNRVGNAPRSRPSVFVPCLFSKSISTLVWLWVHKKTKTYGKIPGVIGRGGFGIEFILAVAFQVYTLGLAMDKVALLTRFFQKLKIGKSQIDAMLNQLAKHLEGEFDTL